MANPNQVPSPPRLDQPTSELDPRLVTIPGFESFSADPETVSSFQSYLANIPWLKEMQLDFGRERVSRVTFSLSMMLVYSSTPSVPACIPLATAIPVQCRSRFLPYPDSRKTYQFLAGVQVL